MSRCKYRDCQLDAAYKGFCTPSHKTMYYRDKGNSVTPNETVTPAIVTQANVTPIDYNDESIKMSPVCRRTKGKVTLPGDPGYTGVCVEHDGQWVLRSSLVQV